MDPSTVTRPTPTAAGRIMKPSIANRTGYVLALVGGLFDTVSVANPTPEGQVGPPIAVLVAGSVLGVLTLVGVFLAWARGSRAGLRVAAGSRVLSMLLGLPALFVDGLPGWVVVATAIGTVVTIVTVVLMLLPPRTTDR